MNGRKFTIGVVAPAARMDRDVVEPALEVARSIYGGEVEVRFHPDSFSGCGHFSAADNARAAALLEYALDETIDAVWFGRGGYGSARIAAQVMDRLTPAAVQKTYLGYSDLGVLLAGLYQRGASKIAHGPMVHDLRRTGGAEAVERALRWLVERDPATLEPGLTPGKKQVAFNLTVLCHLVGTPWEPDLSGHDLLIEEVAEQMYRIDRSLGHLAQTAMFRRANSMRLGRCNDILPNTPDFVLTPEEIAVHWCGVAGVPFLGPADIGHDALNKVVPFGTMREAAD